MNWKVLILILTTLEHAYRLALNAVQRRSAGNPTPANVADVYDAETYQRWRRYSAEKNRLSMVSTVISWVVTMALLCLDVHAAVAAWFPPATAWSADGAPNQAIPDSDRSYTCR